MPESKQFMFYRTLPGITEEQARKLARGEDPELSPDQTAGLKRYFSAMNELTFEDIKKMRRPLTDKTVR